MRLVRAVDENWYEGHCGGQRGIFPVSYVETLVAPDSSMMTPMTSRSVTPMPGLLPFAFMDLLSGICHEILVDLQIEEKTVLGEDVCTLGD